MQKFTKTAATLALLGLAVPSVHAQVVSYYDFGSGQTSGSAAPTTFTPTSGNGTLTVVGFTTGAAATNNVVYFAGSTVNAQPNDTAGSALALLGGTTITGPPASAGNNGGYIQFTANTTGVTGIGVSFATQRTGTGFNSNQLFYSSDGGTTFTAFGSAYTPATAFALQTFDLSTIPALNNNPLDVFKITFTGATSAAGNNRIDNLTVGSPPVAPTPEPSSIVSMFLGAGALGLIAVRRRRSMNAA